MNQEEEKVFSPALIKRSVTPMKFLHLSDLHLGKLLFEYNLLEDQEFWCRQLLELLRRDPHDAVIIAGDLYDRSVPPGEAVALMDRFLTALVAELKLPVLAIAGNHDSPQRLAFGAGLMHTVFEPHTAGIFHYVWFDEQQRPLKQQDSYTQYLIMYSAAERELYIQPYDSTGWTRLKLCDCPASRIERHPIGRSGMDGVTESRDIPAEG